MKILLASLEINRRSIFLDYMKSRVNIEAETELPLFVTPLKFLTICSRYKKFPQGDVKMTPVCLIKLAFSFSIRFHGNQKISLEKITRKTPKQ